MTWDVDRQEVVEAVAKGDVDWIWSVIETTYEERDQAIRDSFSALRHANTKRCESAYHPIGEWSLTDWLTCVAGEVGELAKELEPHPSLHFFATAISKSTGLLAGAIKNERRRQTEGESLHTIKDDRTRQAISDEAADVVIYLDLLLARVGLDLGEAVRRKFNAVSDRVGSDVKL